MTVQTFGDYVEWHPHIHSITADRLFRERGVRIARDNQKGQTAVAQYILRNPFSVGKITSTSSSGMVVYKSKMPHRMIKGVKKILLFTPQRSLLLPSPSISRIRTFSWCTIKAGTQIRCAGIDCRSPMK